MPGMETASQSNAASLIVLMTDFGTEHWYVAAMKGEILRRAPHAVILDLSHHVPRHATDHAAFILDCAADSFPRQTIFLCVVDPGVGSTRRGLIGRVGNFGFVGPDNGLATPLLDRAGDNFYLHEIRTSTFRNERVSKTFHGRDIFAPAAARLLLGYDPRLAGPQVLDPVRLPALHARRSGDRITGRVMMVDNFGNAITDIRDSLASDLATGFSLKVRGLSIREISDIYADRERGAPLCYWGSSGHLEIAVNYDSAARLFGIEPGDPVSIELTAPPPLD